VKKTEYMGPDGDLVANLERDVLDRSPGIRCVGWQACCGVGVQLTSLGWGEAVCKCKVTHPAGQQHAWLQLDVMGLIEAETTYLHGSKELSVKKQ
jgi:hypothetical protein